MQKFSLCLCLVNPQADREIFVKTGLAPELPEDLYFLIKKVALHLSLARIFYVSLTVVGRRRPQAP
jgi:hypothetical protein